MDVSLEFPFLAGCDAQPERTRILRTKRLVFKSRHQRHAIHLDSGIPPTGNYIPDIDLQWRHQYYTASSSPVAQQVEQVTVNHPVGGSSPSRGAIP